MLLSFKMIVSYFKICSLHQRLQVPSSCRSPTVVNNAAQMCGACSKFIFRHVICATFSDMLCYMSQFLDIQHEIKKILHFKYNKSIIIHMLKKQMFRNMGGCV